MTPDILITRIHQLQAELIGLRAAQESLMIALPAELQELWIQSLQAVLSKRADALELLAAQGAEPTGLQAQIDAISSRLFALEQMRRSFLKPEA